MQAERLELAPPIRVCRFHSGDAVEELSLEAIHAVVLLDAADSNSEPHGGIEVRAETPDAVEISQPNVLQPGTTAAVFVPAAEVEWLVAEMRRARAELPGARRQRASTVNQRKTDGAKRRENKKTAAQIQRPSRAKKSSSSRHAR